MLATGDYCTVEELLKHQIYTPEELARLLQMSLYRIRHAARDGELRATIIDHHTICMRREDVLTWLRESRPLATSHEPSAKMDRRTDGPLGA